jgi:hypothetical protein
VNVPGKLARFGEHFHMDQALQSDRAVTVPNNPINQG